MTKTEVKIEPLVVCIVDRNDPEDWKRGLDNEASGKVHLTILAESPEDARKLTQMYKGYSHIRVHDE